MKVAAATLVLLLAAVCGPALGRQGFREGGQEWGYVDVRQGAHMFYWLYYAAGGNDPAGRPLVMWLQGGPGASSSYYGNFEEMGPLDLNLNKRDKSWVDHVNLLFVDNPVGTGFSFVDSSRYLTTNNKQIATDLVKLYLGFLSENPKFRGVPLYIFCESYGGKMAAEFAYELYKEQQRTNNADIDIRGVALGDSWISGIDSVVTWAPYLKQYGLLSDHGYKAVDAAAQRCRRAVEDGRWTRATSEWGTTETTVMYSVPGFSGDNFYNIYGGCLRPCSTAQSAAPRVARARDLQRAVARGLPPSLAAYSVRGVAGARSASSVMQQVHKALGLPRYVRHDPQSSAVFNALREDFMKPVVNVVEKLLSETPLEVTVFNGEWDLIVDPIGTLAWVNRMQWSGAKQWQSSRQEPLLVESVNHGYTKSWGNFTYYSISRAGHMVPSDNPDSGIAMLRRITHLD